MVWTAMAYNQGQRVKPIWDLGTINFISSSLDMVVQETVEPTLIWDMGGILRNRPDPYSLKLNPENEIYIDYGLTWGEDIIDLLMLDRGRVILPLRNLQGFNELDAALAYVENITIGIDWSTSVKSSSSDFSIDIVKLLHLLHQRGQTDILIYSLIGEVPYIPAGTAANLNINLAYLSESNIQPQWTKGVFIFE
tara:strand:- start:580 stop:1161 length:582 start_codon:yes stop_codon:yes gene_type:complete